jgi:F-type H+-transporting ATPase subunit gamma
MPSLAELRKKIKGIKSTRQITKAMKISSGARFARAQRSAVAAKKYSKEFEQVIRVLTQRKEYSRGFARFFAAQNASGGTGVLVVTGDKGLCGGFNGSAIKECDRFIARHKDTPVCLLIAGLKASVYYQRRTHPIFRSYTGFFNNLAFSTAEAIGNDISKAFVEKNLSEFFVIYSRFRSIIKQEVVVEKLLPIEFPVEPATGPHPDYIFEPAQDELLPGILPHYVHAKIYQILRDSYQAELAARMTAMENATRNAGMLIDTVTLEMNKMRQSTITRELIEIVGTNEVVK